MRHAFAFPQEVRDAVRSHVRRAYRDVSPERYKQEPVWVSAVASRLEGTAYDGDHGTVVFTSTVLDDRGRNSAESRYGADLAITADISDGAREIRKAILVQAKLGRVWDLDASKLDHLQEQIRKMQQLTRFPKVLEIPAEDGVRIPRMLSGNRVAAGEPSSGVPLEDYFTRRVLTTLDGDTRPSFVDAVQDSSLSRIHVRAERTDRRRTNQQRSLFDG